MVRPEVQRAHSNEKITVEVVTASNLNPRYLNCVPMFIEFWNLMNINSKVHFLPKVAIVAEELPKFLSDYADNLILISPLNFNDAFVSQVIRIYLAATSDCQYAITSDVDMFPMGPRIYDFGVSKVQKSTDFVILRDVLPSGEFPICYNIATSENWKNIFIGPNTQASIPTFLNTIKQKYDENNSYTGIHGGVGWGIDQQYLFDTLMSTDFEVNLLRFSDVENGHRRLDRLHSRFPLNWLSIPNIYLERFTDYHVHHPVTKYTFFIGIIKRVLQIKAHRK